MTATYHKGPRNFGTGSDMIRQIEALEAENARLREALGRWQSYGCPDCSGDCGPANPPVSCCIMQETRAALSE